MLGLRRWLGGKVFTCQCRRCRKWGFDPWIGKIPWRREWQPIPVFLPGECHGQRSLADTIQENWHTLGMYAQVLIRCHFTSSSLGPLKKSLSPLQDSETRSSSQRPSPFPSSPTRTALDCWSASEFYLDPEQIFQFGPHTDFMTDPVCGQETGVLQNAGSRQGLEGIF